MKTRRFESIRVWMHKKTAKLVEFCPVSLLGPIIFLKDIPGHEPVADYPGAVIFCDQKEYKPNDYLDLGPL